MLKEAIDALPAEHRAHFRELYERIVESFRLRSRIMHVAKDALERIRLEVTCLQFDLEVTRREKAELRQQLED